MIHSKESKAATKQEPNAIHLSGDQEKSAQMRESAWKRQLKQMLAWYSRNGDKTPSYMAS